MSVVYHNEFIKTVVQVMDSNGEVVTSATVQYVIYGYYASGEQWVEVDSGTMSHVGNGVYSTIWRAPSGFYYIYCFYTNPLFNKVFSYVIRGAAKNLQTMVLVSNAFSQPWTSDTNEKTFTTEGWADQQKLYSYIMSVSLRDLVQGITIRVYAAIKDDSTWDLQDVLVVPDDLKPGVKVLFIELGPTAYGHKVTGQSTIAEGSQKSIYYSMTQKAEGYQQLISDEMIENPGD